MNNDHVIMLSIILSITSGASVHCDCQMLCVA